MSGSQKVQAIEILELQNAEERLEVGLLNISNSEVNTDCLLREIERIIKQVRENQIIPFRVKIWRDHPLVIQTLNEPAVQIRATGIPIIIIPFLKNGNRIILHDEKVNSYVMYEISQGPPNIRACVHG